MICPACGVVNLPGADRCEECLFPFSKLDIPLPVEGIQKQLMEDTVADLKPIAAVTLAVEATVDEAIQLMKDRRFGCVLALKGDTVVGIFSERDVLYKLGRRDEPLSSLKISDVMTPNPVTLREEDSLSFVLHQMSVGGFRHIPVVGTGLPPRIVSVRGVLNHLCQSVDDMTPELASL